MGLITAQERQAGTRLYKEFSEEMITQLGMITQGKGLGFTLNEIKQLMDEWGSGIMPKSEQIGVIERKLEEVAQKMQQLGEIKTYLTDKLDRLKQEMNADYSSSCSELQTRRTETAL